MNSTPKRTALTVAIVTCFSLSGCELLTTQRPKLPLNTSVVTAIEPIPQLQNKSASNEALKPKSELYPSSDYATALPAGSEQAAQNAKSKGKGEFSLNFDEADLGEVAKVVLSDILGQNYVLSPKVVGKVTLQTTHALSKEELLPTLEMVLSMNNAALVKDGDIYHIEPLNEALYSANFAAGRNGKLGYQVRVIPVKNVAVDNIAEIIKPLLHDKTLLSIDNRRNLLVVSGAADELARIMDMVNTFDIDILKGRSFALFPLAHVDPETLIKELDEVFYKKAKNDEGEFFRFISIERMNAILAITHQSRYLKDIEQWVARLDRANSTNGGGVNVYKVQHVDAVELADTLNDIFGNGSSQKRDKAPKLASGKKAGELTNKTTNKTDTKKPTTQRTGSGTSDVKVSNVGDVRIIADESNNSLIIVATAQEYEVIRPIINQLDVMPLQVLVDATIVEVTLTDKLEYGLQWYFGHGGGVTQTGTPATSKSESSITPASSLKEAATSASQLLGTGAFGYSFVGNAGQIKAVLNAQADNNNVNVISSPSLMVLNNQEASMQVGTEISLTTGQLGSLNNVNNASATGNTSNVFSQQQQRKTGVKLKIKPRVNANGLVTMDIEQNVDETGDTSVNGNPTILTREITSSVAVQSGETIVLGGLIKDNSTNSKSGIPFLHEVPVIGSLFGSTKKNQNKTELVILITPRVVKSRQDAGLITDEFKRKLSGIYEDDNAVNPR